MPEDLRVEVSDSNSSSTYHKWNEISDLSGDWEGYRDRELESLIEVWTKRRVSLQEKEVERFNSRLAREWSIETGIIEGVYTLDRGVTQILIEKGIDSSQIVRETTNKDPELVARTIQAHLDVLEGLFAFVKGERQLSTSYIKELHAALLRYQTTITVFDRSGNSRETELVRGDYKTLPNNPTRPEGAIHEYCPPEHVSSEMDRLIAFHIEHVARKIPAHVAAAWLHHRFTQIHPFQDGNGRVARAIATIVLIRDGLFPLVVTRDDREKYIDALEGADEGNLDGLIQMFSRIQKRMLTRAISDAVEVKPVASVEEALAQTREMLIELGRIIPSEYLKAKATAVLLQNQAHGRLSFVNTNLVSEIARVNPAFTFGIGQGKSSPGDIQNLGKRLGYDPNLSDYDQTNVLVFTANKVITELTVSFHSIGPSFRGLIAAVCFLRKDGVPPIPLSDDIFRINFQEAPPDVQKRFGPWLEGCLVRGLTEWRRSIV